MLAHFHGQTWNASELARSMDASERHVNQYRDLLAGAFMVRMLPPWFENLGKRLIKSPKVYIRDSGILHYLLGLQSSSELAMHPRYGASWEGFALEQTLIAQDPVIPISTVPSAAPNWTCCCCATAGVGVSNSSARTLPGPPVPCTL